MERLLSVIMACLAAAGILLLVIGRPQLRKYSKEKATTSTTTSLTEELTFRHMAIADGRTKDGARSVHHLFKSSDCFGVSEETIYFNSPTQARTELEKQANAASIVIERGPKLDNGGQQVGERAVLEFTAAERPGHAQIIWNVGSDLHSINAPSLQYALEFETLRRAHNDRIIFPRIDSVRDVKFAAAGTSEGRTEEGAAYTEKQFRSSDCETVTVRSEVLDSPARAREKMEKTLKEAINIIEQGPKMDAQGKQVGQRAVAALKAESPDEFLDQTIVIWTVNSEYYSITGPFSHVLEFERQFYH